MPAQTATKPDEARASMETVKASRLSVNLSPEVADALQWIAQRNKLSITEAVRRCISTQRYIDKAQDNGAKILIEEPGQPVRELIFF
jgi:hypothetical protein